jgi:uncharacterized protein
LQIAVALYHLGNANLRGATLLLGEGVNRLKRYPPNYAEVDVSHFVAQSTELLTALQRFQQELPQETILDLPLPRITRTISASYSQGIAPHN